MYEETQKCAPPINACTKGSSLRKVFVLFGSRSYFLLFLTRGNCSAFLLIGSPACRNDPINSRLSVSLSIGQSVHSALFSELVH